MIEASPTGTLGACCEPSPAACRYTCTSQWAKARTTARGKLLPACVPPTAYANGSALVFYNSTTYRDDMVWAAGWMYKATGERVRRSPRMLVLKHATIRCGVQTLQCLLSSTSHPPLMLPKAAPHARSRQLDSLLPRRTAGYHGACPPASEVKRRELSWSRAAAGILGRCQQVLWRAPHLRGRQRPEPGHQLEPHVVGRQCAAGGGHRPGHIPPGHPGLQHHACCLPCIICCSFSMCCLADKALAYATSSFLALMQPGLQNGEMAWSCASHRCMG